MYDNNNINKRTEASGGQALVPKMICQVRAKPDSVIEVVIKIILTITIDLLLLHIQ